MVQVTLDGRPLYYAQVTTFITSLATKGHNVCPRVSLFLMPCLDEPVCLFGQTNCHSCTLAAWTHTHTHTYTTQAHTVTQTRWTQVIAMIESTTGFHPASVCVS